MSHEREREDVDSLAENIQKSIYNQGHSPQADFHKKEWPT